MKITKKDLVLLAQIFAVIIGILLFLVGTVLIGMHFDEKEEEERMRPILLAQEDILAEYQFENVLWLDATKHENLEGRDDFYIISCLVEDDELMLYRFVAVVREVNGEVDVDTWLIREGS